MASSPITSWKIEGEKVEAVTYFTFLGSKIIVDSDCSHKIKKLLLLGRKTMTNLESILKNRDITLLTKIHIVKAIYGFSSSHVWTWELRKEDSAPEELMLLNCSDEDSWEYLGLKGDQTKPRGSLIWRWKVWLSTKFSDFTLSTITQKLIFILFLEESQDDFTKVSDWHL